MHEQVFVKVNAECDRGVAPLVEALSDIPRLVTLDSCQSDDRGAAHVWFAVGSNVYDGSWHDLAAVCQKIAGHLTRSSALSDYRLAIEWSGSNEHPRAILELPSDEVEVVASEIRSLAVSLSDHSCRSRGDNRDTEPRNSTGCRSLPH